MQQESKRAILICIILSIIAILGIIFGYTNKNPVITVSTLVPIVIYQVFRTKGIFNKLFILGTLIIIIAEIYVIIMGVSVDLTKMSGGLLKSFANLININAGLIGPVILIIFSIYLLKNNTGLYSKWLSVIIILTSVAMLYLLNHTELPEKIKAPNTQEETKTETKFQLF